MRVAVLGAGGFIGRALVDALTRESVETVCFDVAFAEDLQNTHTCITGDFTNPDDLDRLLQDGVNTVFHLVSTTVPRTGDLNPPADVRDNLLGTLGLLEACVRHGVRRVIFPSSGGTVYGPHDGPADEQACCRPICSYGIVKRTIEDYLDLYRRLHGLDGMVLRVANPYGPAQSGRKPQGVIGGFLARILAGQRLSIWGDGSVVRDFVYIDDVADAMLCALRYQGDVRLMNIGTGVGTSVRQIVKILEQVTGRELPCDWEPASPCDVPTNILSIDLARKELAWSPRIDLAEGIARTYRALAKTQ